MKKLQSNKLTVKLESAYIKEAVKLQGNLLEKRLTSMDHVDDFILESDSNKNDNDEDKFYFPKRI